MASSFLDAPLLSLLQTTFGYHSFRPIQLAAIKAVLNERRDAFICLATGAGKSLCYQLPAVALATTSKQFVVVISPLISLMQDQVAKLTQFGVSATFLGSGQPSVTVSAEARQGKFSVVYVTPESAKSFLSSVDQSLLGLIAIDESHCVSEWGHDFRPAYRTLNFIRDLFSHVPIMALTASATHDVQVDIINQLKMDPSRAFIARESFNRSNLYYETRNKSDFLRDVLPLIKSESSIIYTPTKKEAEMYAKMLQDCTISADFYTGDMDPASRERVHANFSDDKLSVVVATIAFGMGIDKPNVRTAIHWGVPKTVEEYYQQSGRAGRDGEPARCILFYSNPGDLDMKGGFYFGTLAKEVHDNVVVKMGKMRTYVTTTGCRRAYLLTYFGESPAPGICNQGCDNCRAGLSLAPKQPRDFAADAARLLTTINSTGNRFGMQIPIDILLGKANAKVTKYAFENLPTFGKGTDHSSDWWKALFWMLVEEQLIIEEIKSSDNPPIKFKTYAANLPQALPWILTDPTVGLSTLKPLSMQPSALLLEQDGKTTSLSSPSRYAAAKASGFTATPAEEALFRRLRDFRSAQAMQRSVPSYLIFHDITLRQIARGKPSTFDQLRLIEGLGQHKLQLYGEDVLKIVSTFVSDELPGILAAAPAAVTPPGPAPQGQSGVWLDSPTRPTELFTSKSTSATRTTTSSSAASDKAPTPNKGFLARLAESGIPSVLYEGLTVAKSITYMLYLSGMPISEIAIRRGVREQTVLGYIGEAASAGYPVDIASIVPSDDLMKIGDALEAILKRPEVTDVKYTDVIQSCPDILPCHIRLGITHWIPPTIMREAPTPPELNLPPLDGSLPEAIPAPQSSSPAPMRQGSLVSHLTAASSSEPPDPIPAPVPAVPASPEPAWTSARLTQAGATPNAFGTPGNRRIFKRHSGNAIGGDDSSDEEEERARPKRKAEEAVPSQPSSKKPHIEEPAASNVRQVADIAMSEQVHLPNVMSSDQGQEKPELKVNLSGGGLLTVADCTPEIVLRVVSEKGAGGINTASLRAAFSLKPGEDGSKLKEALLQLNSDLEIYSNNNMWYKM